MTEREERAMHTGLEMAKVFMEGHGETDETTGEKTLDMDTLAAIADFGAAMALSGGRVIKIPPEALGALREEALGMEYGSVALTVHIRQGDLARWTVGRERSFVAPSCAGG